MRNLESGHGENEKLKDIIFFFLKRLQDKNKDEYLNVEKCNSIFEQFDGETLEINFIHHRDLSLKIQHNQKADEMYFEIKNNDNGDYKTYEYIPFYLEITLYEIINLAKIFMDSQSDEIEDDIHCIVKEIEKELEK